MPVPGTTMREPKSETAVLVSDTMLRWRSTAQMWVVQSAASAGRRRAGLAPRAPARPGRRRRARCAHGSGSSAALRRPRGREARATARA